MATYTELQEAIQRYTDSLNEHHSPDFSTCMIAELSLNGERITLEGYTQQLSTSREVFSSISLSSDTVIVDAAIKAAAVRFIVRCTLKTLVHGVNFLNREFEYTEIHFLWFKGAKISRIKTIEDRDAFRSQQPTVPISSPPRPGARLERSELEAIYSACITSINKGTLSTDLEKWCHPQLSHNAQSLGMDTYRYLIEISGTGKGLVFVPEAVVIDEEKQQVAARLRFCDRPKGNTAFFVEHVLYSFVGGKVYSVWSIVDMEAYRGRR
jgi:predicted ester cyclase